MQNLPFPWVKNFARPSTKSLDESSVISKGRVHEALLDLEGLAQLGAMSSIQGVYKRICLTPFICIKVILQAHDEFLLN